MPEPAETLGLQVAVEGFAQFEKQMDAMDKSIGETGSKWSGLSKVAGGAGKVLGTVAKVGLAAVATGGVAAAGAVAGLTVAVGKLAMEAAPVQGLANAFEGLTSEFEGGSEAMLASLQKASGGMIANRDLMLSFNKAASLVNIDFAQKLPEAMQYLGKVSAATGTDLSYLMDSLVTGVGRLSPMILDNLSIQVSATEANEAYALSIGKSVNELTKAEQQTAMMNLVLEKLAENTAAMPEVQGSAAQGMAQLGTVIQNLKDEIGLAFLPALNIVMSTLGELATNVGPMVTEWAQVAGEWLGKNLPIAIEATKGWIENSLIPALKAFWTFTQTKVIPVLQDVWVWLKTNLPPALAALAKFWQETLLPALVQVQTFLVEKVIPVLTEAWKWIKENLPPAIQTLSDFFNNVLLPALSAIWEFISTYVIPVMETLADIAVTVLGAAIQTLSDIWQNVLYPALQIVWDFIENSLYPLLKTLADFIEAVLNAAVRVLAKLWKDDIYPALEKVWKVIEEHVLPVFRKIGGELNENVMPVLEKMAEVILPAIRAGFELISGAVETLIGWLQIAIDWIDRLGRTNVPSSSGGGGGGGGGPQGGYGYDYGYGSTGGGSTYNTYHNYYLTTQSTTRPGALALEFQAMEAMATR